MKPLRRAFALVAAVLTAACGPTSPGPAGPGAPAPGEEVRSSLTRVTQPAPAADLTQAVTDANSFAFALFRELSSEEPTANLVASPRSIHTALALTYPAARGATQAAFEATLQQSLPADRFHRAMNTLDVGLSSRGQGAKASDGSPFRLRTTNQLFAQQGLKLLPPFLDLLAREYGAGVRTVDYGNAEVARLGINAWVSDETQKLIPELLPKGILNRDTVLTLVNAMYFNAAWATPFPKDSTAPGAFTTASGASVKAQFMNNPQVSVLAGSLNGVELVDLPYDGKEVSMLVLMPPAGKLAAFEASLDGATLAAHVAALAPTEGSVALPRFEVRSAKKLKEPLTKLGLGIAFAEGADLSGFTGAANLFIQEVVHEAVVKTNEAGTEAAAATAVVIGRDSAPAFSFRADRAFLFVLRDRATGAALFVGRVANPT